MYNKEMLSNCLESYIKEYKEGNKTEFLRQLAPALKSANTLEIFLSPDDSQDFKGKISSLSALIPYAYLGWLELVDDDLPRELEDGQSIVDWAKEKFLKLLFDFDLPNELDDVKEYENNLPY